MKPVAGLFLNSQDYLTIVQKIFLKQLLTGNFLIRGATHFFFGGGGGGFGGEDGGAAPVKVSGCLARNQSP
jgi:hypothetical protein